MGRLFMSDDGIWCDHSKPVGIDGGKHDEARHGPADLFEECNPEELCEEIERDTAALREQLAEAAAMILKTHARMERRSPKTGYFLRGALYLFPTERDVSDFSQTRFARILADNLTRTTEDGPAPPEREEE